MTSLTTISRVKFLLVLFLVFVASTAHAANWRRHHDPSPLPTPPPPAPMPVPPPPAPTPVPPVTTTLVLGAFNANAGAIKVDFWGWLDAKNGRTFDCSKQNFIYWENTGFSLDSIINGSQDSVIVDFGNKICPNSYIAPFHEMNGNWSEWDGAHNPPAKIIAAWIRIHNLLGNKVKYALVFNSDNVPTSAGNIPASYYPGDSFVDIVGVDGFDWGGLSFITAINPNYTVVKSFGKPVWVTSTGTKQSSSQAAWIKDAINQAKANNIGGLLYFSAKDGTNYTLNAAALAAFHL